MAVTEEESSSASSNSRSTSPSHGAYYLSKCVLRGSVVLQVVYGHIRSPSSKDIIFGKETSLELVFIDDDGVLQSICEQPVFGTIKDLAILSWDERFQAQNPEILGKDLLVVISDSGKLSFLTFSSEMHRFFPLIHIKLSSPPGNLRCQVGKMLAVDSNSCFVAVSAYEGKLALFSLSSSVGNDIIDKRIFYPPDESETSSSRANAVMCGTIWSMCFISKDVRQPHKEHNPILAILLNRGGSLLNELLLLEWNTKENFVNVISQYAETGPLAHKIVEVPHSYGFAFLFSVGDAILMDLRDAQNPCCVYRTSLVFFPAIVEEHNFVEEPYRMNDVDEGNIFNVAASALLELNNIVKDDDPMSVDSDTDDLKSTSNHVCAWTWEPGNEENPRMIFCVDTGEVFMVEISSDFNGIKVNLSDCLYKGPTFKELLWVEGGFLVALVEMGDGMVLKMEEGKLLYRSPVQNISPILDMAVVDYHDEKHDQMFSCCGIAPEGSLRVIRSGISVEKLLKTAPIYQGITGTWSIKMKRADSYHSFLVLSFVEETRVLSVGVSFTDVTDSVGFRPDVCTLACGLLDDGLLVQIHQNAVGLCLPTKVAHPDGLSFTSPSCTSWFPDHMSISVGAVGHEMIVVGTSNPCCLFVLGIRMISSYAYQIYQMFQVRLQCELSCISIPQGQVQQKPSTSFMAPLAREVEIDRTFVIGTHSPSVEVLSFVPDKGIKVLAIGTISLKSTMGTTISDAVPQDVRFVQVDRRYVLSGLRNGMLLRFEWPTVSKMSSSASSSLNSYITSLNSYNSAQEYNTTPMCSSTISDMTADSSPVYLQLIAIRRIGVTPAFLVPLNDFLGADIIALSDRPWLLHTARHSLSYTSISFQPSTHATPVCSSECPKGILFVSENSLHLVEMVHSKRLNVQKFHLGGTPRKVLFHSESRLLFVLRTELCNESNSSDICCVDPLSGSILSSFKFDPGETGKCMDFVKVGSEQLLVVGTGTSAGPAIMPSGEAENTRGRLIVLSLEHRQNSDSGSMILCSKAGSSSQRTSPFRETVGYAAEQLSSSSLCSSPDDNSSDGIKLEETEAWNLRLTYSTFMRGIVLAVCPYLDRYFLASAGSAFYVCSFQNDNSPRVKRLAVGRTRFVIMTLTSHFTTIAVGDCRDGILFYSYHEDVKRLEQLYSDPVQRLVADCILMNVDTAVVSDRKGSISILSCSHHSEENASPECNLKLCSSFYMGEIAMSIRKGSFSYKLLVDDELRGSDIASAIMDLSHRSIVASTLLGSITIFIPISRDEYELLDAVQARLGVHPLTAPILGNDHNEFRSRQSSAGVLKMLDGDMLSQFLELTSMQQADVLALPIMSSNPVRVNSSKSPLSVITVNQVVRLLERIHYALN